MVGKKNILFRQDKLRREQGFGLVELMVSIGIMMLVLSILIARHDAFNSATLLQNQAYELALAIREKQIMAVSATRDVTGFRNIYGLRFNSNPGFGSNYIIFRDGSPVNRRYDAGEQIGRLGALDRRFVISEIRVGGSPVSGGIVDIAFERPNFDAIINGDPNLSGTVEIFVAVSTNLSSFRVIEITPAGQISVK